MAQGLRSASFDADAALGPPTVSFDHVDEHDEAANAAGPHCPACGFRVFNRRYPRCESCGSALPETLVYSAAQRHALIEADEEAAREVARHERAPADLSFPTIDDSLLGALVDATER